MAKKRLQLSSEILRPLEAALIADVLGGFSSGAGGSAACPEWRSWNRACPREDNGK